MFALIFSLILPFITLHGQHIALKIQTRRQTQATKTMKNNIQVLLLLLKFIKS